MYARRVLNWIFLALISASVVVAGYTGSMAKLTEASATSAKTAVDLAIGLIGQMALWLGFMGVLKEAGLLRGMASLLRPIMVRIFPDVPADHPAMGAMIMNIAANALGLGNAATPFGLKAMAELNKLNTRPGVATNAMALFLVINTSGVAVLPLGVVAVRAMLGSKDPAGVIVPSLVGTLASTVLAVIVCKVLERVPRFAVGAGEGVAVAPATPESPSAVALDAEAEAALAARPKPEAWRLALAFGLGVAVLGALVRHVSASSAAPLELTRGVLSDWLLPVLMLTILLIGVGRHVKVYEAFITAAKDGFQVAVTIIPYLVAIIVAIGMFRASGAMDTLARWLGPVTSLVGLPAEALPMALVRPLSGSGSLAVMTETLKVHGPDSFIGYLVSLINGSSETTFYVLALYFGAVQVRAVRHTLLACLTSDTLGLLLTVALTHLFFGHAPMSLAGH